MPSPVTLPPATLTPDTQSPATQSPLMMENAMSALVPFQFEEHAVRVHHRDGQPWFVLADICRVLDIANVGNAAARLDADEREDIRIPDVTGRSQPTIAVNESGMYKLILRSRKVEAKRFTKWVTGEVLPAIYRTGVYGAPAAPLDLNDPAILQRLLIEHTSRSLSLEQRVEHLEPQAAALARLTEAEGNLCITDAAKALNVAPRRFFDRLQREAWIYRRPGGSHWIGYQARITSGLITHRVKRIEGTTGPRFVEQVLITPKGLAKLAEPTMGVANG